MISNLMMQIGNHTNAEIDESMFRHMVLNALRAFKMKFSSQYGEMVIACDNKNYWRKQIFPYYKHSRKKDQEKSEMDWTDIFATLAVIKAEIKEIFPYRVLEIDSAEADDIIATLCKKAETPVIIISGDKDYQQLQENPNIKQYDPVHKKFISCINPELYLKEHIIRGDKSDGIPNFLSPDNCIVVNERQKSITAKKLQVWLTKKPEEFCETEYQLRNFYRNKQLIDFSCVPSKIQENIFKEFDVQQSKLNDKSKLMNYFMKHRLKNLMESLQDF